MTYKDLYLMFAENYIEKHFDPIDHLYESDSILIRETFVRDMVQTFIDSSGGYTPDENDLFDQLEAIDLMTVSKIASLIEQKIEDLEEQKSYHTDRLSYLGLKQSDFI